MRTAVIIAVSIGAAAAWLTPDRAQAFEVLDRVQTTAVCGGCLLGPLCEGAGAPCYTQCEPIDDPLYESMRATVRTPGDETQDPKYTVCDGHHIGGTCVNGICFSCARWAFYPGENCGGKPDWGGYRDGAMGCDGTNPVPASHCD